MTQGSRRYLKRVWRVPKDRGPAEYLGTLVLKAMRKHGWPAELTLDPYLDAFAIVHDESPDDPPNDFLAAASIAVRITAGRYRVRVEEMGGYVVLQARYEVTSAGQFKELPPF